jgi:fermentation-respiration switch protein FrsA (DUF1100 family)
MKVRDLSIGRFLARLAKFFVALAALVLAFGFAFKNKMIFHPVEGLELNLKDSGWEFEEVWLAGLGGARVNGWYVPGPPGHHTALILHGNGGNVTDMIGRIMSYHWLSMGVLAIDYQGYGLSEGEPSLSAAIQNAVAAWDFLVQTKNLDPQKIVVHGYSLGGGVAGELVKRRPVPHPLVLDSTFTSLAAAARANYPLLGPLPDLILGEALDVEKALEGYRATVVIFFHSPDDKIVPYAQGRALYEGYRNGPKDFVDLVGGHVSYLANQMAYEKALVKNLKLTFPKAPMAPAEPKTGESAL